MAVSTISSLPFEITPIMPLQVALSPCVNFTYIPLRIAQGAFERVPLMPFGQSRLQKAASVLWLYRQPLMTGKYFFLTKKMMKPVTLHQKNAIPSCATEWHFLDLVKVLVEVMNFMRVR